MNISQRPQRGEKPAFNFPPHSSSSSCGFAQAPRCSPTSLLLYAPTEPGPDVQANVFPEGHVTCGVSRDSTRQSRRWRPVEPTPRSSNAWRRSSCFAPRSGRSRPGCGCGRGPKWWGAKSLVKDTSGIHIESYKGGTNLLRKDDIYYR